MSENVPVVVAEVPVMSDDDVLVYTQGLRKTLITEMTKDGMPGEKGDRMVLLAALGDMDRSALGNKKIGAKERAGQADRQAALLIAAMTGQLGNKSPFEIVPEAGQAEGQIPELDVSGLQELTLAPGETEIGLSTIGFEDFMTKVESEQSK